MRLVLRPYHCLPVQLFDQRGETGNCCFLTGRDHTHGFECPVDHPSAYILIDCVLRREEAVEVGSACSQIRGDVGHRRLAMTEMANEPFANIHDTFPVGDGRFRLQQPLISRSSERPCSGTCIQNHRHHSAAIFSGSSGSSFAWTGCAMSSVGLILNQAA